jgi:hypothetical protein
MNTLFWFSFLFASPPNACTTHGTPMLEIRERSEIDEAIGKLLPSQTGVF